MTCIWYKIIFSHIVQPKKIKTGVVLWVSSRSSLKKILSGFATRIFLKRQELRLDIALYYAKRSRKICRTSSIALIWTYLFFLLYFPLFGLRITVIKIFILWLVENYSPNEILSRHPIFISRYWYWDFLSPPAKPIQIEWILCDSPQGYFSREETTFYIPPLRTFLFDEMPWKYIAFKREFNFCEENKFIKCLISLSQDLAK